MPRRLAGVAGEFVLRRAWLGLASVYVASPITMAVETLDIVCPVSNHLLS